MSPAAVGPIIWTLQRFRQTDYATWGNLYDEQRRQLAVTLERPPGDNAPDVACIPAGSYHVMKTMSPKMGAITPELLAVPGRQAIRIHWGDLPCDTEGCILVGTTQGIVDYHDGRPSGAGITGSRDAFRRLMLRLAGLQVDHDLFLLVIRDPQPADAPEAAPNGA